MKCRRKWTWQPPPSVLWHYPHLLFPLRLKKCDGANDWACCPTGCILKGWHLSAQRCEERVTPRRRTATLTDTMIAAWGHAAYNVRWGACREAVRACSSKPSSKSKAGTSDRNKSAPSSPPRRSGVGCLRHPDP